MKQEVYKMLISFRINRTGELYQISDGIFVTDSISAGWTSPYEQSTSLHESHNTKEQELPTQNQANIESSLPNYPIPTLEPPLNILRNKVSLTFIYELNTKDAVKSIYVNEAGNVLGNYVNEAAHIHAIQSLQRLHR